MRIRWFSVSAIRTFPRASNAQVLRAVQSRLAGVAAVARVALLAGPRDRADLPRPVHDPEGMAAALQDVEVAPAVDRHGPRIDHRRRLRVGTVRGHAFLAVARHGGHDPGLEVDATDPPVIEVRQVHRLPGLVEGEAIDPAEFGPGGRPAIPGEPLVALYPQWS